MHVVKIINKKIKKWYRYNVISTNFHIKNIYKMVSKWNENKKNKEKNKNFLKFYVLKMCRM